MKRVLVMAALALAVIWWVRSDSDEAGERVRSAASGVGRGGDAAEREAFSRSPRSPESERLAGTGTTSAGERRLPGDGGESPVEEATAVDDAIRRWLSGGGSAGEPVREPGTRRSRRSATVAGPTAERRASDRPDSGDQDSERVATEDDSQENAEAAEVDPEYLADLEEDAARAAEALGLMDPEQIESRVERLVPEGSVPANELAQAREDARRQVLADAAIIHDLAGRDAEAAGWADTLLPTLSPERRATKLEGAVQNLGP